MLFARVRDYALCGSQSEGSIPDYPDDEHETLCGCLCVCVVLFLYGHPERAVLKNF